MNTTELPEGWTVAKLGDGLIEDVQPGFACGKHNRAANGIAHLRPMNVNDNGEIDLQDVKYVAGSEADRDERRIRRGDVLFNNTNSAALVGKTAYYADETPRAFSNHMTRVRCRSRALDAKFCALAIHQLWREGYFANICSQHVNQASISRFVLLDTAIPIPPLREQHRIVARAEALLAEIKTAHERLVKLPIFLKQLRQSILRSGSFVTSPKVGVRRTRTWNPPRNFWYESGITALELGKSIARPCLVAPKTCLSVKFRQIGYGVALRMLRPCTSAAPHPGRNLNIGEGKFRG